MAITLLGSGTNNYKTSGTVITSPAVSLGTFAYQTGDVIPQSPPGTRPTPTRR